MAAKSFIKWVGGKGQLLDDLAPFYPEWSGKNYHEPFLGGGATFFAFGARFRHSFLSDTNEELINTYTAVRDHAGELIELLTELERDYNERPEKTYLVWRDIRPIDLNPVPRAARFILINKTGFNGLYRVNKFGYCNVAWGKRLQATIFDKLNILECSRRLQNATLKVRDFADSLVDVQLGDMVYCDSPYIPASATADFTGYTQDRFSKRDHERLVAFTEEANAKGARVLLSNSDTRFTRDLYNGYKLHAVEARRAVNVRGDRRGPVGELLILANPPTMALNECVL